VKKIVNQGIFIVFGILISVALIVLFSLPSEELNDLTPIKIVANLPLTGPGSGIGLEDRDGLLLSVDDINSMGGINGRPIELVIVDNETDLEKAKQLFLETEQTHKPILHISSLSFITTGLSVLAEENKVVLIALSAVAPEVTQNKEWTFRYFPMADAEATPILQILNDQNITNLGILYLDDEFGRSITDEVGIKFENTGGSVFREPFSPNSLDFVENLENIKNNDAIYIVAFPNYIKIILKQLHELNYSGQILTSSDGATFDIFSMSEADGVYLAAPILYDQNFQYANKIGISYEMKYNKQLDYNSANSYDVLRILNGILDEEKLSTANIRDTLNSGFTYSGIFGKVTSPPKNHDIEFNLYPAKIVNGELNFGT